MSGADGGYDAPSWQASSFDDESALVKSLRTSIGGNGSWDNEVVQELLLASSELRSVYSFYARLDPVGEGIPGDPNAVDDPVGISLASWSQLVEDVRISKLVTAAEIFTASCLPEDPSTALLDELQFLGALVRLAHSLSRAGADLADATHLLESLRQVLHECVLPFARRDNSTSFNKVMGTRPELVEFLDETRRGFSGFGAPSPLASPTPPALLE